MMNDNTVNFYDVCKEAEKYFEIHDKTVKGSGWKGFQRWKHNNEYKYYPSGDRHNVDPYFVQKAYRKFLENSSAKKKVNKNLFNNGWESVGPHSIDSVIGHYSVGLGRIEDFYVDPTNSNKLYLASRSGGFWKSLDGGTTWQGSTTDTLFASGVNAMAVSPTNSNAILINVKSSRAYNISHGIYQSLDGGDSWIETNFNPNNLGIGGLGSAFRVLKIAYHPTIANLVFVLTSNGLYRSTDNLQSWTHFTFPYFLSDIAFHPTNSTILYVATNLGNGFGVKKSVDGGLTYSDHVIPGVSYYGKLSVSNGCASCLFYANDDGVWKSTNEGVNYSFLNNPNQNCDGFVVSDLDPTKMIYGAVDMERSIDGGQNFEQVTNWNLGWTSNGGSGNQVAYNTSTDYVHADVRNAQCINGVFYVATDGLLCKSSDDGLTWEKLSRKISIRENYKLGVSQSNHYRTIVGSQDNGTSIKHKSAWLEFFGADGMEGIIHPLNDDWMIGSYQYGGRNRTKDGGGSYNNISPLGQSGSSNADWEAPILYDPNDHMRLYNLSDSLFVSEDFGSTWNFLGDMHTTGNNGNADNVAIAENNSNIMLVSVNSTLKKSINGGSSFVRIGSNVLSSSTIQDIAFDPRDDNTFIVTYANYQNDNAKVFMTTDGGNSWINITYNLGDMPIHSVVIDHTDQSNIYLGAEMGVYTMPKGGTVWSLYNTDLPNMSVEELEIVYGSNTLRAATWGRGVWEYSLMNRSSYPAILKTNITNQPTDQHPREGADQYVTSVLSMENAPTSVYLEWSINAPTFGNRIDMLNNSDSTWKSETPIPNQPVGTKVFFKVFAVLNGDTTETYKFMYNVKPFEYCSTSGTMMYQGNVTLVHFNEIYRASGKTQPYTDYTTVDSTIVYVDSTYGLSVNLNTDNGGYTYYAKVWFDWNQDADFDDPNEAYELGSSTSVTDGATSLSPYSVVVPSDAMEGRTRMRVACRYSAYPDECDNNYDGEVEDYLIVVKKVAFTQVVEQNERKVLAYPNPTSDIVHLELKKVFNVLTVNLFDLTGRLIVKEEHKNLTSIDLNLEQIPKGNYVIEIVADGTPLERINISKQ